METRKKIAYILTEMSLDRKDMQTALEEVLAIKYKEIADAINWLQSELAQEEIPKLDKIHSPCHLDRVRFLKRLIHKLKPKTMHNFKLGDEVYHKADSSPFEVVGVRETTVEIEGDWSGGTHNVKQKSWVDYTEIEPYDITKVTYYINGKPFKNNTPLTKKKK